MEECTSMNIGNLIMILTLVCAVVVPLIVALFSDIGHGLKMDRRLIIGYILRLPIFVVLSAVVCVSLLIATLFKLEKLPVIEIMLIISSIAFFIVVFIIAVSIISWLFSEDASTTTRPSYKEKQRLKYLNCRNSERAAIRWKEFWEDSKPYTYFNSQGLTPYARSCIQYMIKIMNNKYGDFEEIAKTFSVALYALWNKDDLFLGPAVFPELLNGLNGSCETNENQLSEVWIKLISTYIHLATVRKPGKEENAKRSETGTTESYCSIWLMPIIIYCVNEPIVTSDNGIECLCQAIAEGLRSNDDKLKREYLIALRCIDKLEHRELSKALRKLIIENDICDIQAYLSRCAHRKEKLL